MAEATIRKTLVVAAGEVFTGGGGIHRVGHGSVVRAVV